MRERRSPKRAVQLSPETLGVSEWQRDFWLALIEHAQSGQGGQPDLSRLEGFKNPALIRHAVTTPELQHGFDKHNAGNPYHRQVRPFGFMVMFQQEELTDSAHRTSTGKRSRQRVPNALRIIAPFNRNPAIAARHAFDRDTGTPISAKQLKTYARALRHYHDHPEAKFLNGERTDRGPTTRRHIIVRSIRHIGKEANRLDDQMVFGVDPSAQAEFGDESGGSRHRISRIKAAIEQFGPLAVARGAGISRQHLYTITSFLSVPREKLLQRIEGTVLALYVNHNVNATMVREALLELHALVARIGLRRSARALGSDAGHLSRVLSGARALGEKLKRCLTQGLSVTS